MAASPDEPSADATPGRSADAAGEAPPVTPGGASAAAEIAVPPSAPPEKVTDPPAGRLARTGRRVAHAAVVARDASVAGVVTAVTPIVRAVGVLLSLVLVALAVPAVLLLVVAWWRPGPADWFWTVLAAVGLGTGAWLRRRQRQLLATVAERERLIAALTRVLQGRDIADRVTANLAGSGARVAGRAAGRAVRGSRGLRLLRGMWRGVQLTGVVDELLGADDIAPLTPGRIRGIAVLTVVCAVAAAVLWVCLAVATLAFLAGA